MHCHDVKSLPRKTRVVSYVKILETKICTKLFILIELEYIKQRINRELRYMPKSKKLIGFDWAIKKLLRSKVNFGVLEGFLSELLKCKLKIVDISESESNKETKEDKYNKVDVLVKLDSDELVLIEVQVTSESDYFYRMIYGASKVIVDHITEGAKYSQIKKVYSVNILYFDLGHGSDYLYHGTTSFTGINDNSSLSLNARQKKFYKRECVHQIYPEYYLIKVNQFNDIAKNTLDEWIYFLKNEEIKDSFKAKGLLEAKEKLDYMKLSEPERREYQRYLENKMYQESMADSSFRSGQIDGEINGLKKIAKNLKAMGMTTDVIQKATGLSINEIDNA